MILRYIYGIIKNLSGTSYSQYGRYPYSPEIWGYENAQDQHCEENKTKVEQKTIVRTIVSVSENVRMENLSLWNVWTEHSE